MLTVDTIPLRSLPIADFQLPICNRITPMKSAIANWQLAIGNWQSSFGFFVARVLAATATEFAEFQAIRRGFLILGRHVVPALAITTLKHNVIAWHLLISYFLFSIANFIADLIKHRSLSSNRQSAIANRQYRYSTMSETVPAPTVRPPSRIAKRSPFSIAIGAINSISIATLSPGITISTPVGKAATPVTSVVRK